MTSLIIYFLVMYSMLKEISKSLFFEHPFSHFVDDFLRIRLFILLLIPFLFSSTSIFDAFGYKKHSQEMMNKTYLWCFWVCLLYSLSYFLLHSFLLMLLIIFFSILFIKINEQEDVFGIIQKWIGKEIQKIAYRRRCERKIICLFIFAFVLLWEIWCSRKCKR